MKRSFFWLSTLVALLMLLSLVVACGGTTAPTTVPATSAPVSTTAPTTPAKPGAGQGGKLVLASSADKINLDPGTTVWNSDIMYHLNIYDVLYRVNRDGTDLLPSAATSYSISADGKSWTFKLAAGHKFSDGTPIKSSDWKYSITRAMDPKAVDAWAWEATGLQSMDTPDELTIVFNLKDVFVPFLSYVAGYWAEVFPEAAITAQGDKFWDMPVCSGPFMVSEFVQSDHLTLVPNPYSTVKPLLSEIKITCVPDDNTRILQLQSGAIDVAINMPYSQIDSVNLLPGLIVRSYPFAFETNYTIVCSKAPTDDVNMRMALNYATDRAALIKAVTFNHTTPWTTVAPKGVMYRNDAATGYAYDMAKAKDYLAKSKYASGAEIILGTSASSLTNVATCTALQGMWQQLPNIKVTIAQYEPAVYRVKRDELEFNIFAGGFSSDVIDPDEILSWWMTGYVQETWAHADVSKLTPIMDAARKETDPAKRKDYYFQAQQWAFDNAYSLGLWYQNNDWGMKKTVQDFWVDPIVGIWFWQTWVQQ